MTTNQNVTDVTHLVECETGKYKLVAERLGSTPDIVTFCDHWQDKDGKWHTQLLAYCDLRRESSASFHGWRCGILDAALKWARSNPDVMGYEMSFQKNGRQIDELAARKFQQTAKERAAAYKPSPAETVHETTERAATRLPTMAEAVASEAAKVKADEAWEFALAVSSVAVESDISDELDERLCAEAMRRIDAAGGPVVRRMDPVCRMKP